MAKNMIKEDSVGYLLSDSYLSDRTISRLKEQVRVAMLDKTKDTLYHDFMNWKRKVKEFALFTEYAALDLTLPARFDTIKEDISNGRIIKCNYSIRYAVFNGWVPVSEISRGHKHVCILEFPDEIPDVLLLLPEINDHENKHNFKVILSKSSDQLS